MQQVALGSQDKATTAGAVFLDQVRQREAAAVAAGRARQV
jgi:hypothetical protein